MGFFGNKEPVFDWAEDVSDYHYEISLTPRQRELLLKLIAHEEPRVTIRDRNFMHAMVKNAKRHHGPPLPDASLDWRRAEREARERGESVPDWLFDRPVPPKAA